MNNKVRVLHAITRMILGGAQLNTLYTCRLLDKARFSADLVSGPDLGPEGDLLSAAIKEGIPTTVLPSLKRGIHPWNDFLAYRQVQRFLRKGRYDVVHTHTSKAGILVRKAAGRARVPVIIHTAHGWQWTPARSGLMNRFIIDCERWAARNSDRIVVVAERDREKGLSAGVGRPEQYRVIESAIPLDTFDPEKTDGMKVRTERGIPSEAPVFGTVGRFAYQKAPEMMLEAARLILSRNKKAHFVYVGDGPLKKEVLKQMGSFAGHPRLHLLGLRQDISEVVGSLDIFLLSSRYEGLPRVVVEAMALGKPVVTTPADGVTEIVIEGETGRVVPHGDGDALASAALDLLKDVSLCKRMGQKCREMALKRFDLKRMVAQIEQLYEEVIAEKVGIPGRHDRIDG